MVRIVSDTSTLYSTAEARTAGFDVTPLSVTVDGESCRVYISHADALDKAEKALEALKAAIPDAVYEILPLSPAFITQGGPGCIAVQIIEE